MSIVSFILVGVLLNTFAQLLLKVGMNQIGHFELSFANIIPIGLQVISTPPIIIGLICYVISVAVWLIVLSRVAVSYAYPMLSIGYVFNALIAHYWLGEPLSSLKIAGIFIIITGVYLLSQAS